MSHNVLHVLGTALPEGSSIARIVAMLGRGLDPERYRLLACFLGGDGVLVGHLKRSGVRTFALDWTRGARDPAGAWGFWRRLRSLHVDIVHLHFGGRSVRGLARAATRAKIVTHLHTRILEPRGLDRVTFSVRGTDAVVAVSQAVANQVRDGQARVIYAGADLPQESVTSLPRDGTSVPVLGTAGRLIPLKGIKHLLSAAAALEGEFPSLRVEIAGAGSEQQELERWAGQLGISQRVGFLGWVEDLSSVFPRWDVFVMPSIEEGFPIAALEAMAAGLPVVAAEVGGVGELVVDGETGCLVPPADPATLAARLRSLLNDPNERLSMGVRAQQRVRDHFSPAQMVAGFTALYDELLGLGVGPASGNTVS